MGAYLQNPKTDKDITRNSNDKVEYLSIGMQGWRTSMEDSHVSGLNLDDQDTCVFGVFDGHGGKEVAEYVSTHFIQTLKQNQQFKEKNYQNALTQVFIQLDNEMLTEQGQKDLLQFKGKQNSDSYEDGESQAGCTGNVILITFPKGKEKQIICANAGDSRSIVISTKQKIQPLSIDHKPDLPDEKDRIMKAGGFVNEGRVNANLNLSRAFGDYEYKNNTKKPRDQQMIIVDPEIQILNCNGSERWILIGCDGVWEMLRTEEIVQFIDGRVECCEDLRSIMEQLFDKLIAKETISGVGCDNMTAVLIVFQEKGKK